MNERSAVPPPTRYPKVNCGPGFATNSEIQIYVIDIHRNDLEKGSSIGRITDFSDFSIEPQQNGRRINIGGYWETPNDAPAWEGTETTCTMHSLNSNTTYYFVVRAFSTSGDESGDSNKVPCGDWECDLNNDGTCDMQDWLLFGEDWGKTDCPH